MSWDKKQDGDKGGYYYVSVRQGDQVVKQYLGRGERAQQAARAVEQRHQERQAQRDAYYHEIASVVLPESLLHDLTSLVTALVHASLLAAGFHRHRRSWRKRRCPRPQHYA